MPLTLRWMGGADIVATAGPYLRASTEEVSRALPYSQLMAGPPRVATAAALMTGALLVAAGGFVAVAPTRTGVITFVFGVAVAPVTATLGVVIARRTTGNPVGGYLAFVGLALAMVVARETANQYLARRPELAESVAWLVAVFAEAAPWLLVAVALLLLYFPDGRLPSQRWRWVPPVLVACAAVNQVYGAMEPVAFRAPLESLGRPFEAPPLWFDIVAVIAFVALLVLGLACGVSLVLRYRRSPIVQRRQIRWLAMGGLLVLAYPLLCLAEILVFGSPQWPSTAVGLLGLAAIPVMTGIAMLRHDLYDVDRAISGTVTWGLVTTVLLSLYAGTSVATGVILGRDSAPMAAAVTALGVLALAPLKNRLQGAVDRRLYPLRRAAFEALENLQADISADRTAPEELERVLRSALRDPALRVGYQVPGQEGFVSAQGDPVDLSPVPGQTTARSAAAVIVAESASLTPELLRQVLARAAPTAEMVRLRLGLVGALREVESSRSRLVQLGYEERRRLERDLHDGAQQRLVSLGMTIRVAQRHLHDGTVDVDALLDECVAELATAVAELRQLAHGIRPSSLDDGLPAAVARLVRNVPVEVALRVEDSAMPDEVATTAYFVISEALANAVKHAHATLIELEVERLEGRVVVRVRDDGRGGANLAPESGMADRVAALGGSLRVASPRGRGTLVQAELPCAS